MSGRDLQEVWELQASTTGVLRLWTLQAEEAFREGRAEEVDVMLRRLFRVSDLVEGLASADVEASGAPRPAIAGSARLPDFLGPAVDPAASAPDAAERQARSRSRGRHGVRFRRPAAWRLRPPRLIIFAR
jgi:hypothetical protein